MDGFLREFVSSANITDIAPEVGYTSDFLYLNKTGFLDVKGRDKNNNRNNSVIIRIYIMQIETCTGSY